jgi:hypothetical protein
VKVEDVATFLEDAAFFVQQPVHPDLSTLNRSRVFQSSPAR